MFPNLVLFSILYFVVLQGMTCSFSKTLIFMFDVAIVHSTWYPFVLLAGLNLLQISPSLFYSSLFIHQISSLSIECYITVWFIHIS